MVTTTDAKLWRGGANVKLNVLHSICLPVGVATACIFCGITSHFFLGYPIIVFLWEEAPIDSSGVFSFLGEAHLTQQIQAHLPNRGYLTS
jgi:hypothetical protein